MSGPTVVTNTESVVLDNDTIELELQGETPGNETSTSTTFLAVSMVEEFRNREEGNKSSSASVPSGKNTSSAHKDSSVEVSDTRPEAAVDNNHGGIMVGEAEAAPDISAPDVGSEMKFRDESNSDGEEPIQRTASDDEARHITELQVGEADYVPAFIPPDAGTPAAAALAANAAIRVSKMQKGLHKFHVKKPSIKTLNIVKRLKKSSDRRFSKNFKGKVIDGVHELYTLTAGMILGIRCSIGRLTSHNMGELALEDFSHVDKLTFPPRGCDRPDNPTPSHSLAHTFKFKSYSLKVFRRLRDFFGIDNAEYMNSVCGNYNYLEFISNSKGGQFFFYSHDGKYMIKTQTKEENRFMKKILPHYYKYVTEHPHTMLVRILGMHRVKMYHLRRKVHFVIMSSVFDTPEKIHTIYDLKGSLVGRKATDKERAKGGVLKDQDLLDDGMKIKLGYKKQAFVDQLEKDATFLADLNIMDYSLLFGIHDRRQRGPPPPPSLLSPVRPRTATHSQTPFRRTGSADAYELELAEAEREKESQNLTWTERIGRRFSASASISHSPAFSDDEGNTPDPAALAARKDKERSASDCLSDPTTPPPKRRDRAYSTGSEVRPRVKSTPTRTTAPKSPGGSTDAAAEVGTETGGLQGRAAKYRVISASLDERRRARSRSQASSKPRSQSGSPKSAPKTPDPEVLDKLQMSPRSSQSEDAGYYDDVDYDENEEGDVLEELPEPDEGDEEEEYEDHDDEGDSVDGEVLHSPGMLDDTETSRSETRLSITREGGKQRPESEDKGKGLFGAEGGRIRSLLRTQSQRWFPSLYSNKGSTSSSSSRTLEEKEREKETEKDRIGSDKPKDGPKNSKVGVVDAEAEEAVAFGPGAARVHPWTTRNDNGINSRLPDGTRGPEIYYVGIIDILQRYNLRKQTETIVKGFKDDRTQISSVDAKLYAKRFVKFVSDNTI